MAIFSLPMYRLLVKFKHWIKVITRKLLRFTKEIYLQSCKNNVRWCGVNIVIFERKWKQWKLFTATCPSAESFKYLIIFPLNLGPEETSVIESRWKIQVTIMSFGLKVWYKNSANKMYDIIIFFLKSLNFYIYLIITFLYMPTDLFFAKLYADWPLKSKPTKS